MSSYQISFIELIRAACDRKEQVRSYIGDDLVMRDNWKLRAITDRLSNNSHISIVNERPLVFEWKPPGMNKQAAEATKPEKTMVKSSKQPSEVCEQCDAVGMVLQNEQYKHDEKSLNENNVESVYTSHTSYTSHSNSVYAESHNGGTSTKS